jgi:hypothetical protein
MRSTEEIRRERERFRQQALEYGHEKQRPEAWLCASIVNTLSWVLGETSGPTVRAKLEKN